MIPASSNREVTSSGVATRAAFGISEKDTAHIMGILRDGLYSDRVLAVLREYSANAWDAHRQAGKSHVPISVTVPTYNEPFLEIRDYGPGLSVDDVLTVYTQYGASTKRDSDLAVGMLGIGCKSAFAYADTFTITSYYEGTKSVYVAVLDASERGEVLLMHEEPTDETGISIRLAVHQKDISEFRRKAENLFRYFNPRPTINLQLPQEHHLLAQLQHGGLMGYDLSESPEWIALMGCIPYKIDLDQVPGVNQSYIDRVGGILHFDIGEVNVAASREALKYTAKTKEAIVTKIDALVDEFVRHTIRTIEGGAGSNWRQRLDAQVLRRLKLPIPVEWDDLVQGFAKFDYSRYPILVFHNNSISTRITVHAETKLWIDDTGKPLVGYKLGEYDWVARPTDSLKDPVDKPLAEAIEANGLEGIPVCKLSDREWTEPPKKDKPVRRKPHKQSVLVLKDLASYKHPYSDAWKEEQVVPSADDVYVVLDRYRHRNKLFYSNLGEDMAALRHLELPLPRILGYRKGLPIGKEYYTWQKEVFPEILMSHPRIQAEYSRLSWLQADDSVRGRGPISLPGVSSWAADRIEELLGASHELASTLRSISNMQELKASSKTTNLVYRLIEMRKPADLGIGWKRWKVQLARYPLLQSVMISQLWSDHKQHWADYIKMMDERANP